MLSEGLPISAIFAHLVAKNNDAQCIAETAVSSWRAIESALAPIIGRRGVAALYKRSLHLTRSTHPCLAMVFDEPFEPGEFDMLNTVLTQQSSAEATAANCALLQTFHDLLINLIGGALTERLLRTVWNNISSSTAVQDSST